MNDNYTAQRQAERQCLETVNNNISYDNCFNLSEDEYRNIKHILTSISEFGYENSEIKTTKFPDFKFNGGFIEHFAVTSSKEDKKGSKQMRESKIFDDKVMKEFKEAVNNAEEGENVYHSDYRNLEEHSHFNLMKSILKNCDKHINSYERCSDYGDKDTRIFMIEYIDFYIQTALCRYNALVEVHNTYKISKDERLLDLLYQYKDKIDYIVFVCPSLSFVEIIKLDAIPEISESLKTFENVIFESIVGMEGTRHGLFKIE